MGVKKALMQELLQIMLLEQKAKEVHNIPLDPNHSWPDTTNPCEQAAEAYLMDPTDFHAKRPTGFNLAYKNSRDQPEVLIPIRQPLYDTILIKAGVPVRNLGFFRDVSGKTDADTNLILPGTLAAPEQFAIFGFALNTNGAGEEEKNVLFNSPSSVKFSYSQSVQALLTIPLNQLPEKVISNRHFKDVTMEEVTKLRDFIGRRVDAHKGWIERATMAEVCKENQADWEARLEEMECYEYNANGEAFIHMRASESFFMDVRWNEPITLEKDVRLTMYIDGFKYIAA